VEDTTLKPVSSPEKLIFKHLPRFARFIREQHLEQYIRVQLSGARELNTPLLRIFDSLSDEDIIKASMPGHIEFLQAAEENRLGALLEESSRKWINDQLEGISRDAIEAEDITQVSYLRKNAMMHYIPLYTSEMTVALELVREIDQCQLEADTISINTYMDILQERLEMQTHALKESEELLLQAQTIADLGSFEWNFKEGKISVSPQLMAVLELDEPGDFEHLMRKVYPADKDKVKNAMATAIETGLYECEYRMEGKGGKEKIIWSRGVVKTENGAPVSFKGTAMDVTEKHHMIQRWQRSEELYKQAQAMSHIGNWTWDLQHEKLSWSDELYRVYGIEIGTPISFDLIFTYVHPDDQGRLTDILNTALETKAPFEFFYRIISSDKQLKILHARGEVLADEGKAFKLLGTVQDVTERQTLLEQLQERDERYKEAQARTHIGNWSWDIEKNKVTWSDEMYRIYGLEPQSEEISLQRYICFVHPEQREDRRRQIQESIDEGKSSDFYFTAVLADGREKIIHSKSEVVYANGKPVKMIGTCQDVTERQRLIEKLLHNEELYKQAQALSHLGNFSWDLRTDVIEWTDECFRICGLEPQSQVVTFDTLKSFIHPEDRARVLSNLEKAIQEKTPYEDFYRIISKVGEVKIIHRKGELVLDEQGVPIMMNGTTQDVTQQQLTEQQLRSSREFIEKIADTTPSLITTYNINTGAYTFVNKAIKTILGYETEEAFEKGVQFFLDILHPDDLPLIVEQNAAAVAQSNARPPADGSEPVVEFKYRIKHVDGSYHWFRTFATIFDRSSDGKVQHVLNVSIDVTEQERAEQKLQQKNMELLQSNASLEEYAYVASHDLKEPLRKIATFSDRLVSTQHERLTEDGKLYLGKIIESSRRMQKMISDLLAVSVISGNKKFEPVNLREVFEDVVQTLEYKIEEKNALVVCDDLPQVRVVPSQFRQLFQNLIGNSLKFSREDVRPEIKVTHRFLNPSQVSEYHLAKAGRYLRIDVADNGIGFDNQFVGKIFTIFQRLHGKSEYEGTGIGLAICRKIAENHGGTIIASGRLNEGSTFTVIIPI